MTRTAEPSWEDFNQASIRAALAELRVTLAQVVAQGDAQRTGSPSSADELGPPEPANTPEGMSSVKAPPALDTLCATFGLSAFERKILLMCAAVELDSGFAELYQSGNKGQGSALPTFTMALAAFDEWWAARNSVSSGV